METIDRPKTATRLIHHLDAQGYFIMAEYEPEANVLLRQQCFNQSRNLMEKAGTLVHTLRTWQTPFFADALRGNGYTQAIEHVCAVKELEDLLDAVRDLRGYLSRVSHQGLLFPTSAQLASIPEVPREKRWRRA